MKRMLGFAEKTGRYVHTVWQQYARAQKPWLLLDNEKISNSSQSPMLPVVSHWHVPTSGPLHMPFTVLGTSFSQKAVYLSSFFMAQLIYLSKSSENYEDTRKFLL